MKIYRTYHVELSEAEALFLSLILRGFSEQELSNMIPIPKDFETVKMMVSRLITELVNWK